MSPVLVTRREGAVLVLSNDNVAACTAAEAQLELEDESMVEAVGGNEALGGSHAFLNQRPPNYTQPRQVRE